MKLDAGSMRSSGRRVFKRVMMEIKTLMAHFELGRKNEGLLAIAANLARQFKAHVIGIASCQPMRLDWEDIYIAAELAEDRKAIEEQLNAAEQEFRASLDAKAASLEWRSTVTRDSLASYIANQARATDLIVTGPEIAGVGFDHTRRVGIADLVMEAGRPVLLVPERFTQLALNRVLVAWKNTRECRRAVSDALPLLKLAQEVTVTEIADDEGMSRAKQHVSDVGGWFARHGIRASCNAIVSVGADADCLREIAAKNSADLVVAGAYGHSRLHEWALGGVTRDFLFHAEQCVFVSN